MEENNKKAPEVTEKATKAKKTAKDKPSLGARIGHFFRGYKSEVKKIVWCPWNQVRKNSLVVLAVVITFAVAICAVDFALSKGIFALGSMI